jgi:TolB protein
VIITSTPTPVDIMTAVATSLRMTAEAVQFGVATPLPANWVTPVVVTPSPTPANEATASYFQALAIVMGTPTPTPANLQTATPTPVLVFVEALVSPTATATPSATPQAIPAALMGKIIFLSDRQGATEEERAQAASKQATPQVTPQPYVFDPATGKLAHLTDLWPYEVAAAREGWSADTAYEAYTKELLWTNVENSSGVRTPTKALAIHYYDYRYNAEQIVTRMGAGIVYDPAWSPISDEIVFVATESGNDEIWLINRDGTNARQLTRNQWEWDKHPSWSPDGQQIVFFSNRTGNSQLWIMNKDGSDQRLLMEGNAYNDWNPVWVKTLTPAPPLARQPDWRFVKPASEQTGTP